jgi:putative transposase
VIFVKILKAYRFKLKTNDDLEQKLSSFAGHCRFVWNYFWRINHDRLMYGQRIISNYNEMDFWSKLLKSSDEYAFLQEAPAHIIQQKLKDLAKAYKDGFDKTQPNKRLPTRRKKHEHSSFRFPAPNQIKIDNRRICLPKLGWIGFYKSCAIDGDIRNVTVSYKSGDWYISIQVVTEQPSSQPSTKAIGLDVGIEKFVVGSSVDGDKEWLPINSFRTLQAKIAKEQRKLKHKQKYSANWLKKKKRIQKLHTKVSNKRNNHLHKISTEISKSHAIIFVEDLKVKNISASAKGTVEQHGKNVKAKSGLNKSILDQGWYKFKTMLDYKSRWRGGKVIEINPRYTSQICSCCGYKDSANRKSQEHFECLQCGFTLNADYNAARNILAAGLCRVGLSSEPHWWSAAETSGKVRTSTNLYKQESPCFS